MDVSADAERAGEVPVAVGSSPEGTIQFENRTELGVIQYLLCLSLLVLDLLHKCFRTANFPL